MTGRAWLFLVVAGMAEVVWAVAMKQSNGFSRLVPTLVMVAGLAVSFVGLAAALKVLPVGTGYAVWTGIGAAGTALAGMWLLGEPRDAPRLVCIALIVAGIIGLRLTMRAPAEEAARDGTAGTTASSSRD
jgi:quaternary ammonium compound-resistance protein SugE